LEEQVYAVDFTACRFVPLYEGRKVRLIRCGPRCIEAYAEVDDLPGAMVVLDYGGKVEAHVLFENSVKGQEVEKNLWLIEKDGNKCMLKVGDQYPELWKA
jgi:hypothetical protein